MVMPRTPIGSQADEQAVETAKEEEPLFSGDSVMKWGNVHVEEEGFIHPPPELRADIDDQEGQWSLPSMVPPQDPSQEFLHLPSSSNKLKKKKKSRP